MNATRTIRRDNTSGLPGIRPNVRKGYAVLDVSWNDETGRRRNTSYPIGKRPLLGVERAIQRRLQEAGALYELTPRQAWEILKAVAP